MTFEQAKEIINHTLYLLGGGTWVESRFRGGDDVCEGLSLETSIALREFLTEDKPN